jgi:UDP-glucuronate 4-epimerase
MIRSVTRPIPPYAATKIALKATAHGWHHLHGTYVVVLRYFTLFGPAGRSDMACFGFCEQIRRGLPAFLLGCRTQTRDSA